MKNSTTFYDVTVYVFKTTGKQKFSEWLKLEGTHDLGSSSEGLDSSNICKATINHEQSARNQSAHGWYIKCFQEGNSWILYISMTSIVLQIRNNNRYKLHDRIKLLRSHRS